MSNATSLPPAFAGIDVGKARLQLAIRLPDGKLLQQAFDNTQAGRCELIACCRVHPPALVVLEATGGLELDMAAELSALEIPVSIITPAQSRAFARALGRQAKTDAIDAQLLAAFAASVRPKATQVPSETQRILRELASRRRQLLEQLVQEKNRLEQARDRRVRTSVQASVAFLEKQLSDIDRHLGELLAADEELLASVERLDSVPAIGPVTAAGILIACPELGTLNRQQIASLAGLAPFNKDSGSMEGQRSIRGGRKNLRSALYMPTLCAIRYNPIIKAFYENLLAHGKKKIVALTAAMRKLLILLNSLQRQKKTWAQFTSQPLAI